MCCWHSGCSWNTPTVKGVLGPAPPGSTVLCGSQQDLWVTAPPTGGIASLATQHRCVEKRVLPFPVLCPVPARVPGHVPQPDSSSVTRCALGLRTQEFKRIWCSLRMSAKGVSHNVSVASQTFHELPTSGLEQDARGLQK